MFAPRQSGGVLVEGQGVEEVVERNRTNCNADDGIDISFGSYTPAPW